MTAVSEEMFSLEACAASIGETVEIVSGAVWQAASASTETRAKAVAVRLAWRAVEIIGWFPQFGFGRQAASDQTRTTKKGGSDCSRHLL